MNVYTLLKKQTLPNSNPLHQEGCSASTTAGASTYLFLNLMCNKRSLLTLRSNFGHAQVAKSQMKPIWKCQNLQDSSMTI